MKLKFITKITTVVVAVLLTTGAFAQNGRFSLGAELALPTGDFGDNANTGFGGSLRYELPLPGTLALTGTAGYITYGKKTVEVVSYGVTIKSEYTYSMIPVQVGLKYYFQEQQDGFYVMGELGIHSFSSKYTSPSYSYTLLGTTVTVPGSETTATDTDMSFAPGIGYHLSNLDLGARYQIISTTGSSTSYIGVRVAYVFGSK